MPTTTESRTEIFTKLFAESRQALHRYIRRFVGSSETAKEIVQEAFLRTYRQRESVTTLRAFLFSTARNLAANEYRHRRTMERSALGDFSHSRADTEHESLETELLRDERNRADTLDVSARHPGPLSYRFDFQDCDHGGRPRTRWVQIRHVDRRPGSLVWSRRGKSAP